MLMHTHIHILTHAHTHTHTRTHARAHARTHAHTHLLIVQLELNSSNEHIICMYIIGSM